MRVLGLLRADASSEAGTPPDPELFAKMGPFMEEVTRAGVLVATDGLLPSSKGARVKVAPGGKVSVRDGPFTESKELVASYAILNVKTMEEAVHWTARFLEVLGGGECELRPILEYTDHACDGFGPDEAAREAAWREEAKRNAARG